MAPRSQLLRAIGEVERAADVDLASRLGEPVATTRVALHRARRAGHVVVYEGLYQLTEKGASRLEREQQLDEQWTLAETMKNALEGGEPVPNMPVFICACTTWVGYFSDGDSCTACGSLFQPAVAARSEY